MRYLCSGLVVALAVSLFTSSLPVSAQAPAAATTSPTNDLFRADNLMAWCIVPFDAKKRGPEERAAMLEKLGFKHFAYDYRGEHVPTFAAEIEALKKHGVSLDAWWFPGSLNAEAKHILEVCKKHGVTPQLWVTGSGSPTKSPEEQRARVVAEANRIRPIAEAAAAQGMKVGLYNHGGWFGEPENQLEIIAELKLPNVGIVYNQHHGHAQVERFAEFLPKIIPHLLVLNLNGMNPAGDQRGQKILQLGQGELDLKLLKIIRASDYRGPIGILGHTQDDAEARLADNLDGLRWLLPQLDGAAVGPKPKTRTPVPGVSDPAKPQASGAANGGGGYLAEGKAEYRALPITVELRAALKANGSYNILVANETKRSPEHWEIFTMPAGTLAAYLPGRQPDHVHTKLDICDGKPHDIAFVLEADRGRLYIDGTLAGEQALTTRGRKPDGAASEKLGFLRLVEGGIGSSGALEVVRISHGVREITKSTAELNADAATVGFWRFTADAKSDAADASKLANPAVRQAQAAAATQPNKSPVPTPGVHLKPVDPAMKVTLIDRSPDEVYMGVRADTEGNVFVGGREGLFVFERASDGTFKPRRELLRFPKHSIIMGLEVVGPDLFVLTANALYRVKDGRTKREGLEPERVLWGLPLDLHVSFHCVTLGPFEDKLYITHGDPLLNYGDWNRPDHWGHWVLHSKVLGPTPVSDGDPTAPKPQAPKDEWLKTNFTGQGAVLEYSYDTGKVGVLARGLRGPVGLAFDDIGNLYTNDNDHESRADQYAPAKLLHVRESVDFGWPRSWMASKSPERIDVLEPMCDLGRGVPCDLTFYDRAYLPESVRGRLLQCRWDSHSVNAYRPVPYQTTYRATEETVLKGDDNCRPVGIAIGPGGELFVTAVYMTGNMAAPYCTSDLVMVTRAGDEGPLKPTSFVPSNIDKGYVWPYTKNSTPSDALANAVSDDPYKRQQGLRALHDMLDLEGLTRLLVVQEQAEREVAAVVLGRKLTIPAVGEVPPESLQLNYPKGNGWFHRDQQFYGSDAIVDLADFARIGSYTMAERWKAVPHSAEQEQFFALLVKGLDDPSERVRLQAAYFLGLLRDPRSEPKIDEVRRNAIVTKLKTVKPIDVGMAWNFEPHEKAKNYSPEKGPIDLTATPDGAVWELRSILSCGAAGYRYFGIQSGSRQQALLTLEGPSDAEAWVNGVSAGKPTESGWIIDLQPGGNEILLRTGKASNVVNVALRASGKLEVTLAEKLDSGLLAARLREAAAAGGAQPIAKEFLAFDWTKEAALGDAAAGRKLFGTLACTKCHAITADQKSAGAPSLLGARLRFTVPHLVESVLLPSRQVAEPFRAQSITTTAGLTVTGLVVGETADGVEVLLPDATRRTIAVKEIEERTPTTLSPMPQGLVKTPAELRDLLAYLLSEKPTPP